MPVYHFPRKKTQHVKTFTITTSESTDELSNCIESNLTSIRPGSLQSIIANRDFCPLAMKVASGVLSDV